MMEELLSHLGPRVLCLCALPRSSEAETRRTAILNTEGKTKVACRAGGTFSSHSLGLAGANTQTVTLTNSLPGKKMKFYKICSKTHLHAEAKVPLTSQLQALQLGKL